MYAFWENVENYWLLFLNPYLAKESSELIEYFSIIALTHTILLEAYRWH